MQAKRLICGVGFLFLAAASSQAEDSKTKYPVMAPFARYQIESPAAEIALARSAAPPSISADADVLTLGEHRYETAIKGNNGFVCLVERAWGNNINDDQFWNPSIRAPICFNAAAARTVLPGYLEKTEWVLAGTSTADMIDRTKAEIAANRFIKPEPGAMCYMMSKDGFLSDDNGPWRPHLMFFLGSTDATAWGANLHGSPIFAAQSDPEPITTFMVPVTKWSDGTTAAAMQM
jgi:hypothetical protein